MRSVLAALAVGGSACLSTPPARDAVIDAAVDAAIDADPCVDGDGDGWPAAGPTCGTFVDCADGDLARYPGAREADDGVADLDCDGATLDDVVDVEDLDYSSLPSGGVSVVARILDLEFGVDASYQLSSLRTTNGVNDELLFTGPMAEKWSGVNVWQAFFSTVATGTPVARAMGPAVFRWEVPYDSNGGLIGTSLYTVTIDGRVYRSDTFNVAADPAGADHSVTGYVALNAATFVDVMAAGQAAPLTIGGGPFQTYFEPFVDAATWLCARTNAQDVVWAQAGTSGPTAVTAGPRITSGVDTWGEQVALQYDWQFDVEPVVTGAHAGHFLLAASFRATEPCSVGAAHARGFQTPALAEVTAPGQLVLDDAGDVGIRDGFIEAGGYYLVDAGAGPGLEVRINAASGRQPPIASTWRIRGLPAVPAPVVLLNGTRLVHGRDYRVQPDGAAGLWLVVTTTLMDNHVLRLVVPRQTLP